MTQINSQINLIMLANIEYFFFVFHIDCHKFIANLRSMLCIIYFTKLFIRNFILQLWLLIQINCLTFNLFTPSIFIQTFSEKNHIKYNCFIVNFIYSVAHSVEIKRKYFICQHFISVLITKLVIVPLPSSLISIRWKIIIIYRINFT